MLLKRNALWPVLQAVPPAGAEKVMEFCIKIVLSFMLI